ncbi:MAG: MFS transporter [Negativicutes bacterium]|nr:MFS transporter [Negativicutes bacterium]
MFKKHRWNVLTLLFFAAFINYVDRAALSIAAPFISKEYHLSPADLGMIFSSFFVGYAVFNFIGGYFSDIYGPRRTFSYAMGAWSIFSGLTILTYNFVSLFIVRVLFGMGEGPISSGTNKMINNWFPAKERARAVGISISGMPLGAALTGPIVGFIALAWGWRMSFVVLTVAGLIWTAVWVKLVRDYPEEDPRVSAEELEEIKAGQLKVSDTSIQAPLSYFLKQPTILATAFAFFACNYITYFFLTWFPSYLVMAHDLSIKNMSIVTIIPWLIGFFGMSGGGFISDYIFQKVGDLMFARKIVIVVSLLASALAVALCGFTTSAYSAVALMSIGIFFMYATISSYWAIIQDTVRSENVGGVGGFVHFLSNLAGIVGPSATGFLVQATGNFTSAFLLTAGLAVFGALAVVFYAKPIKNTAQV